MSRRLGNPMRVRSIERPPVPRSESKRPARPSVQERLRETERQLREQHDLALTLLRMSGHFTWVVTPDGTLRDATLWCEFTGQSQDAAAGRGWLEAVHPEDRARLLRRRGQARTGKEYLEAECRIRRHDGLYRTCLVRAVPIMDAQGDVREWASVCLDITERALLSSASHRPADHARALASQLAETLEMMTGGQLTHEASADVRLIALLRERATLTREREQARADALALAEANQRMDEFLAVAAHDLKSPMTSSKGYVQLAMRRVRELAARSARRTDVKVAEDIRLSLERADQSLRRLSRLAERLLDFGRIRAGKLQLSPQPANLISIVREVVEDQQLAIPSRTIRLETPAGAHVPVFVDADRIGQVVTNFLTNALRYGPSDRPVAVTVETELGVARVSVRDEGRGIPVAQQKVIWRRFEQARLKEQQSDQESGLGLGLYIAKSIIQGHHGAIGVVSRAGHGATFWFTLPLAAAKQ